MAESDRALAALRTVLYGVVFGAVFLFYLPWTWAIRGRAVSYQGVEALRLLAVVPLVAGAYVMLRCVSAFVWTGRGTPLPFDPPRRLVVSGFYRYVRNPMFIGVALFLFGEVALWGSLAVGLQYLAYFCGVVVLFILLYEEPALRAKFGADYEEYCRNVPRFLPRLTPWQGAKKPTAATEN